MSNIAVAPWHRKALINAIQSQPVVLLTGPAQCVRPEKTDALLLVSTVQAIKVLSTILQIHNSKEIKA
ncbi:MAG: hypothetical protein HQL35_09475 [Alphaproteobacteria bacterium]|nr:hypothetical protein [Alphaproteobacteria bacterium]